MGDAGRVQWSTKPVETGVAVLGALVLGGLGFTVDPTGRWLVWAGGLLLLGIAVSDVLLRPRLRVDETGVAVRSLGGRTAVRWEQTEVRIRRHQRFGRTVPTLELDLDDKLVILGRRELGTDPDAVESQLNELRKSMR